MLPLNFLPNCDLIINMHLLSFTWVSSSCAIIRAQIELVVLSTEDLIVCNSYVYNT